jgi:hypothetical protein
MTLSRPSLVALTSLLLACSDPFTPPAGTLTGTFDGPDMELSFGTTLIITGPTGSTSDQRTLTRGTKADFSDFACAAS